MKGVKVYRCEPSDNIEILKLLKDAIKEGVFPDEKPTPQQLRIYNFEGLLQNELPNPNHFWLLAKRAKGRWGILHAYVVPNRWDRRLDRIFVDLAFVRSDKRKLGIGKKLIDDLFERAQNIGITKIEFLAKDKESEMWIKERGAEKVSNLMRVNL